jgi:hypothetical protein
MVDFDCTVLAVSDNVVVARGSPSSESGVSGTADHRGTPSTVRYISHTSMPERKTTKDFPFLLLPILLRLLIRDVAQD